MGRKKPGRKTEEKVCVHRNLREPACKRGERGRDFSHAGGQGGRPLKESARQGSVELLHHNVGAAEVVAAKNAQASTNPWTQQPNPWSSPAPSAGPSSWQGASESGSAGNQCMQSQQLTQLEPIDLSWKGANKSGSAGTSQPIGYWLSQSDNVREDCKKIHEVFEEAYEKIVSGSSLSEKEEELFKALLYAFNLNNQILECHQTNFIVKNGKIASLIDDSVNVKEYLQKVIDKTKEEYRVNKEEAYDLNEFLFFLI
ncbi:hypothetical protein JTE90_026664 [Oedothorax gibbosus]|uniref:Uncharacterized protein n=1 Tax=Oedothorax gibbosus TaxID=931172 RepID=A0AAV6TD88_9ARAC|nr:hypothetical protein JTE90_026664 [Oedothorax gibbosus]